MALRLGTRIALAHASLVAGLATAGALVFLIAAERALDGEMSKRARTVAAMSARDIDPGWVPLLSGGAGPLRALADAKLSAAAGAGGASRIVVLDSSGRVIATSDPAVPHGERFAGLALDSFEVAKARREGAVASMPYRGGNGRWYQTAWTPIEAAVLGAELEVKWRAELERLRRAVLIFALLGTIGAAVIGFEIARGITRPLARLTAAMKTTDRDGLPLPAGVRGSDEVGELGLRFDELVEALRRHDTELRSLAATVAHEVRNPLGAMSGWSELLARRATDDESKKMIAGIRAEIEALERLVSRFLSFAGDPSVRRAPTDLAALLEDAIRAGIPPESAVRIERAYESGVTVDGDPDALREVFVNLLRNGAQATSGKGTLSVAASRAAGAVEVRIRDDGPGVPAEMKDRLFQPFATTKADGTGLGLAISKRIVSGHGGTLSCETGPAGTTFLVRIPVRAFALPGGLPPVPPVRA